MALSGNGGRPYENQVRNLYIKYYEEYEECKKSYQEAIEEKADNVDVLRGRYVTLRSITLDLFRVMKTCGYLDADELATRK